MGPRSERACCWFACSAPRPNGALPCSAPPSVPPLQSDYISFRHHTYEMPRGEKSVAIKECGPRFEMKLYQVRQRGSGPAVHPVVHAAASPHARHAHLSCARRRFLAACQPISNSRPWCLACPADQAGHRGPAARRERVRAAVVRQLGQAQQAGGGGGGGVACKGLPDHSVPAGRGGCAPPAPLAALLLPRLLCFPCSLCSSPLSALAAPRSSHCRSASHARPCCRSRPVPSFRLTSSLRALPPSPDQSSPLLRHCHPIRRSTSILQQSYSTDRVHERPRQCRRCS